MADKNELTDSLLYGIDLKNRRIYFGAPIESGDDCSGDFNQTNIELAIRSLHRMSMDGPGKPIELYMSSYGGDPYAMLRLYDEILSCPCQVKFFGSGAIMSAATWIMVVCDERYLHPHTTIMVHDGSEEYGGKHTDVQITAAEMKRLQDVLYDIYASNTRMPKAFWQDVCQRDLYITAEEAIMLGMADKLIEPKKRGNLRKVRQAALKKMPDNSSMRRLVSKLYERINKVRVPKIEFNAVEKEPSDPELVVQRALKEEEKAQQPESTAEPDKTNATN